MTTTDDLTTRLERIERMQEKILKAIKPPRLMTIPQAAQHAGRPVTTFRRLFVTSGKLQLVNGKIRAADLEGLR